MVSGTLREGVVLSVSREGSRWATIRVPTAANNHDYRGVRAGGVQSGPGPIGRSAFVDGTALSAICIAAVDARPLTVPSVAPVPRSGSTR